jgi:GT2 family glycosyltransferase
MALNYSLIIPILNRGDKLLKQLATLTNAIAPKVVFVVDNSEGKDHSVKDAVEKLEKQKVNFPSLNDTTVIISRQKNNLGVAASWNFGIRETPGPWIIANSDIYLRDEDAITTILSRLDEFDLVIACCMSLFGIKPEAIEKAGTFDENFWPAYNEDLDYVTRLVLTGGKIFECAVNVEHEGSSTLKSDPRIQRVIYTTHGMNDNYFLKKWGSKQPNTFKGQHVYGRWSHPYNDPKISPKEWLPDDEFVNRKKQVYNEIMI